MAGLKDSGSEQSELDRSIGQAHEAEMRFLRRLHERARGEMRRVARKQGELTTTEYGLDGRRRRK
jgi:hypothetical protein